MKEKPLGQKSYGSIGHVPGSRVGPGDHTVTPGQARIVCERVRDKNDHIIVQVKLDGSNVSVANVDGHLIPLGRAGYPASTSKYRQHHMFNDWVYQNLELFSFLEPGERLCGEWLAQAHGTKYNLLHSPFVPFDLMTLPHVRATLSNLVDRLNGRFVLPYVLSDGPPRSIEWCKAEIKTPRHGELDPVEGVVWRCERNGKVDFLCKWVREDKIDGKYLPELYGKEVWNWKPQ